MKPMRVAEVNYTDLAGRAFNGYDLHLALNEMPDVAATQYVLEKQSGTPSVKALDVDHVLHQELRYLERKYSMSQLLAPYGRQLLRETGFLNADAVHLHILHLNMVSLLDIPELAAKGNAVWTIHDPWILTGNCVHPLHCGKWKTGCRGCGQLDTEFFKMYVDNAGQMWQLKKAIFAQVNPYVVVASKFMEDYIRNSPVTAHWNRIVRIPFGIKENFLAGFDQREARVRLGIEPDCFAIGFRLSDDPIKGCKYIFEALEQLECKGPVQLLIAGEGSGLPENLRKKYACLGPFWLQEEAMIQFYQAMDVFLMPSLAESFGLMAVEAMACETAVVCFQSTVLEEVTCAPEVGIAVEYCSAAAIADALDSLIRNREKLEDRKQRGKRYVAETYPFHQYVERHLQMYREIQTKA